MERQEDNKRVKRAMEHLKAAATILGSIKAGHMTYRETIFVADFIKELHCAVIVAEDELINYKIDYGTKEQ